MNIYVNGRKIAQAGNYYYDFFNQEMYMLLFYHDIRVVRTWTIEEAKENYNESKYSVLSHLSDYYKFNHHFQFLLEYEDFPYLIWKQSKTPMEETTVDNTGAFVEGYEPVQVPFDKFTGLAISIYETYLDGTSDPKNWHYSIGITIDTFDGSIPGPITTKVNYVQTVALWVKFPVQKRITCFSRLSYRMHFTLTFLLVLK